jgi:8-oxo-dGTP pyrophosphatase MutT (NUDIX family)
MTAAGGFVLVRQERVPIRATIWEFPAWADRRDDGEQSEEIIRTTGLRELREESGYELAEGGEILSLGHFFPSAGFTDEHSYLLLARPCRAQPRWERHTTAAKQSQRVVCSLWKSCVRRLLPVKFVMPIRLQPLPG